MFKINDVIVYENGGVCRVEDIGIPEFIEGNQRYYKLQSLNNDGNTIYVKTENQVKMRYIITNEEAVQYLENADDITSQYNEDSKQRDKEYAKVLKSGDFVQWISMLKGILTQKNRCLSNGKKLNSRDDMNLKKIDELAVLELSIALGVSKEEVRKKFSESFCPVSYE